MKRKIPLLMKIVAIAAVCLVAGFFAIMEGIRALAEHTEAEYKGIKTVDISAIPDGDYGGKAGAFLCSSDLTVTVRDHQITDIKINREVNGGGKYRAEDIYPRMIKAQSPMVDTVSGATLTSKTVMVAVYKALTNWDK